MYVQCTHHPYFKSVSKIETCLGSETSIVSSKLHLKRLHIRIYDLNLKVNNMDLRQISPILIYSYTTVQERP